MLCILVVDSVLLLINILPSAHLSSRWWTFESFPVWGYHISGSITVQIFCWTRIFLIEYQGRDGTTRRQMRYLLGTNLRGSSTYESQSLWGLWVLVCMRFVWALWVSLAGMEFDSKCKFTPTTILLGLLLCPRAWVSPHSSSSAYHLTEVSLTLDVGYFFTPIPAKSSCRSWPWTWGIFSPPLVPAPCSCSGHINWKRSVFILIPKKGNAKECSNHRTIALFSHTSKVMLKILQARLQQYINCELPDVQAGFRKGKGTRDQIANICRIAEKARDFQKNIYFCFIDYAKAFDCVDHHKLWKILKEMGIPDHLTCLLRNLYAGQEATVRTGHGTTDWF